MQCAVHSHRQVTAILAMHLKQQRNSTTLHPARTQVTRVEHASKASMANLLLCQVATPDEELSDIGAAAK